MIPFRPDAGEDGCGPERIDTREAIPVLIGPPSGSEGDSIDTMH